MTLSRIIISLAATVVLAGCAASLDGFYEPGCPMHAGDTVTLDDGRFVWDKFTDVRIVGEGGELETPYPDYPKAGTFSIDGDALTLESDSGETMPTLYVLQEADAMRLLTTAERQLRQTSGETPECALKRTAGDEN